MTRFQCACTNFPFNFCINKKITSTAARTVAHAYCHITSTLHSTAPFSCKDSLVRFYSTALIPLFLSLPSSFLRTPLSLSPYWSESTSYLSLSSFSLLLLFVSLSVSEWVSESVSISISKLKVSESTSYLSSLFFSVRRLQNPQLYFSHPIKKRKTAAHKHGC